MAGTSLPSSSRIAASTPKKGVIAEPEITEHEITDADICMVIASDGVWELVESQEVADLVSEVTDLDPAEICRSIVHKATHMWKVEEGDYRDDITVIVMALPWVTDQMVSEVAAASSGA